MNLHDPVCIEQCVMFQIIRYIAGADAKSVSIQHIMPGVFQQVCPGDIGWQRLTEIVCSLRSAGCIAFVTLFAGKITGAFYTYFLAPQTAHDIITTPKFVMISTSQL